MSDSSKLIALMNIDADHHLFSPSAAERWMGCPASVLQSADITDVTSAAAAEGTLAHDLSEKILRLQLTAAEIAEYDPVMVDFCQTYVSYARDTVGKGKLLIEQRVDLGDYIEGCKGTADVIGFTAGTLDVIDLKYGTGIQVFAENNKQLMLYALGAASQLRKAGHKIKRVRVHIAQPRLYHFDCWEVSAATLKAFADDVRLSVSRCLAPDPEFNPSDKACQWCRAKATCPALYEHTLKVVGDQFEPLPPEGMTQAQMRLVLDNKKLIEAWLKAIEAHIFTAIESGDNFQGYKMVEGRSQRRWLADAATRLEDMLGDDAFNRNLKNITTMEKALGKKHFAELQLTQKPKGKPVLVREDDPRTPIEVIPVDFEKLD
jgi:hypothetical protein